MSAAEQAVMAGNRAALAVYGGAMTDPGLAARLSGSTLPTLVLWGDSDRIADPAYGRAFAAAIPGAVFRLLPDTGHVPQIETPGQLLAAIQEFAGPGPWRPAR
jgi:pimeloyl-ACP methyl ester carboxylesterase